MILAVVLDMGTNNKGISLPVKYYAIMKNSSSTHSWREHTASNDRVCEAETDSKKKQLLKA